MYNAHFNFRESPFGVTPDPQFYYSNAVNRDSFASICRGIADHMGVFLIVGEPGTGKTTLLQKVLQSLGPDVKTAYLSQTMIDDTSLLDLVINDLGLRASSGSASDAGERLRRFLVELSRAGKNVALLIDEAQNLSPNCLEELQYLSSLEAGGVTLLQVVLAGQPELAAKLEQPGLLSLRRRIARRYTLDPLTPAEVALYIDARLQAIGHHGTALFEANAVEAIASFSAGVPRLVNLLCDHALLVAYAMSESKVSAAMVEEVAGDLQIAKPLGSPCVSEQMPARAKLTGQELFAVAVDHRSGENHRPSPGRHPRAFTVALLLGLAGFGAFVLARHNRSPAPEPVAELPARSPPSGQASSAMEPATEAAARASEAAPASSDAEIGASPIAEITGADAPGASLQSSRDAMDEPPAPAGKIVSARGREPETEAENTSRVKPEPPAQWASFVVVGRSFVRAQPTSEAEIIATLEPGADINVAGRRGDYFRIRASGDRPIAGYVHREDAFFERKK